MSSPYSAEDTKLFEKFVQGSNQLLANERVRMETIGNLSQLVSRAGEVLAVMHFQNNPRTALVKSNSAYADQLEDQLQKQNFVLLGPAKRAGYMEYCQYVIPAGYQVHYTEPALLWKKWWPTERFQNKQRFNMNILVRMKDNWYPVQNIVVEAGMFTVKTLAGQTEVSGSEQILWLSQIPPEEKAPEQPGVDSWEKSPELQQRSGNLEIQYSSSLPSSGVMSPPPAPPSFQKKIQELEMRLYKQQQATIAAEQRAIKAEQRAIKAEQQLALMQSAPRSQRSESEVNWIH